MHSVSPYVVQYAQQLGRQVVARALVIYVDAIPREDDFRSVLLNLDFPTILISRSKEPEATIHPRITVPDIPMTRTGQIRSALLVCLARQVLNKGDRVIFLSGVDGSGTLDTMLIFEIGTEPELFSLAGSAPFVGDIAPEVFERVLTLATELAIEGREGRPVGSLFVLGDSDQVMEQSRSLVLNPFQGHPEEHRNILNPELEETIKEFAALDGAFVIRGDGVVLSAGSQSGAHGSLFAAAQRPGNPTRGGSRNHRLQLGSGSMYFPVHRDRIHFQVGPPGYQSSSAGQWGPPGQLSPCQSLERSSVQFSTWRMCRTSSSSCSGSVMASRIAWCSGDGPVPKWSAPSRNQRRRASTGRPSWSPTCRPSCRPSSRMAW